MQKECKRSAKGVQRNAKKKNKKHVKKKKDIDEIVEQI